MSYLVNGWVVESDSSSLCNLQTGERKQLGEYQIKLLETLIQHAGQVMTREELTAQVWQGRIVGNNSLPNAIHALRSAVEDNGRNKVVIKTISKKGYLLDAQYCHPLVQDAPGLNEHLPVVEEQGGQQQEALLPAENSGDSAPLSGGGKLRRSRFFIVIALLLLFSTPLNIFYWLTRDDQQLQLSERQINTFSNIRLFSIADADKGKSDADEVYQTVSKALYSLNNRLKNSGIQMSVYYRSLDQTLNYTFYLSSSCDTNQLVMTIYHWRLDAKHLNDLILSETERKLNEMAHCTGN